MRKRLRSPRRAKRCNLMELERTQIVKEKFKMAAIKVRKECDELRDVNTATAAALERETKRARKEEWGRNKF